MKNLLIFLMIFTMSLCFSVSSCHKEINEQSKAFGQVNFVLSSSLKSSLKATSVTLTEPTSVVVTIEDASGNVVENSLKIDLYNMNGSYISKPISLVKGRYKLTRFLVLNSGNSILFASPLKGSAKAYLVQAPLPITFDVNLNVVTKLNPEVISVVDSKPEDFGYATFGFDVTNTFDFLIGAFVYNDAAKNFELTNAAISIMSDTAHVYSGQLSAIPDNSNAVSTYDSKGVTSKINLSERYSNFTIVITKTGYKNFSQIFSKDELKLHYRSVDKGPLVVILEKSTLQDGLIADYQFNGNVKDASGQGNDGTINGTAVYVTDRLGNANGAMDFTNNSSVSAIIGRLGSMTISAWVKMPEPTATWYPTIVEYLPENQAIYNGAFFFHLNGSVYQAQDQGKLYYSSYGDRLDNSTRDDESTPSPITYDTWNHLSFTYDSVTQVAKMYVNNALITTKTSTNSLYNLNLKLITIGRQLINNPDKPTNLVGCIDELWIYRRALTLEEIKTLSEL